MQVIVLQINLFFPFAVLKLRSFTQPAGSPGRRCGWDVPVAAKKPEAREGQSRALWASERIWVLPGGYKGTNRRFSIQKDYHLIDVFLRGQLSCHVEIVEEQGQKWGAAELQDLSLGWLRCEEREA